METTTNGSNSVPRRLALNSCICAALLSLACPGGNDTPDAQPLDTDSDGILDSIDNCPALANADQHDIDADGVGDVCDNCPTVANEDQAGTLDDDAVGDACDPRPTEGGDSFELFVGQEWAAPNNWTEATGWIEGLEYVPGGWDQDEAPVTVTETAGPAAIYKPGYDRGSVLVESDIEVLSEPNTDAFAGLLAAFTNAPQDVDSGYGCWMQKTAPSRLFVTSLSFGGTASPLPAGLDITAGQRYRLGLYHYRPEDGSGDSVFACKLEDAAQSEEQSTAAVSCQGPASGTVGVIASGMSARFHHVLVYSLGGSIADYESPNPC